jgi:hypothetical protein
MAISGYQLICPVSNDKITYSSINVDNLSDLFPEEITTDFGDGEERISWRVKKFPNGIEDFTDWMCRASEITSKRDAYYFTLESSGSDTPVFLDTETVVSSVDPVAPKSPLPILRTNIDYVPYNYEIPLGDPRIRHDGSANVSMGGSIDLYDSSQPFLSSLEASESEPQFFGYQKSGPTGEGFNTWMSRNTLRMFLFKGDFYVAHPFRYNTGSTYIIDYDLEVSSKKIKVTLFTRTFVFSGAGGIVEYTITDTFA